jgi:hypothetical protein
VRPGILQELESGKLEIGILRHSLLAFSCFLSNISGRGLTPLAEALRVSLLALLLNYLSFSLDIPHGDVRVEESESSKDWWTIPTGDRGPRFRRRQ